MTSAVWPDRLPIIGLDGIVLASGSHARREQAVCATERQRRPNGTFYPIHIGERLWGRSVLREVNPFVDGPCWVFLGNSDESGYGTVRYHGLMRKAHRVSYELLIGPIPVGLLACHKCDNPPCINPMHLFLGSITDNNRDRHAKGRTKNIEAGRAERHAALRSRTHCPHGHVYDAANTLFRQNGSRECRACSRDETRRYRERLKGILHVD